MGLGTRVMGTLAGEVVAGCWLTRNPCPHCNWPTDKPFQRIEAM